MWGYYYPFFKKKIVFIYILDRREGRKRGRETCTYFSHAPNWGLCPQPRLVPQLEIQPATLWFAGRCPVRWATPARALSLQIEVLVDASWLWEQVRSKSVTVGHSLDLILNHIRYLQFNFIKKPSKFFKIQIKISWQTQFWKDHCVLLLWTSNLTPVLKWEWCPNGRNLSHARNTTVRISEKRPKD